jgi:hypothetical protein
MKTTISKIIDADKALGNLLQQKLPLAVSIQLGKIIEEIKPIFVKAQTYREEVLQKYGSLIESEGSTGQYKIKPENIKNFEDEMRKEFEVEIELTSPQIDPERLPDSCLTGAEAISLSWLWKGEGE